VVDPFADFVQRWLSSFAQLPSDLALDEQIYTFVEALVDFLHDNRELLRLLVAAEFERDETLQSVSDKISAQFAEGLRTLADEAGHDLMHVRSYNVPDAGVAMAAGVSMALSMVLLERWVFVHDQRTPRLEQIAREVSQMILYGISARPR
jgi:hypothetical protein